MWCLVVVKMGNKRNKRQYEEQSRLLPPIARQGLQDSDKGSYYQDWIDVETRSTVEQSDSTAENGILIEEEVENVVSASERKLLVFPPTDYEEEFDHLEEREQLESVVDGSRIIDISLISPALKSAARCSECNVGQLSLLEKPNSKMGWASTMYFFCDNCKKKTSFNSSRHVKDDKTKPAAINT